MKNLRDHQFEKHQDKNPIWKHLEVRLFNFLLILFSISSSHTSHFHDFGCIRLGLV